MCRFIPACEIASNTGRASSCALLITRTNTVGIGQPCAGCSVAGPATQPPGRWLAAFALGLGIAGVVGRRRRED